MHQWRFVGQSVQGTSHTTSGIPCQDFNVVDAIETANSEVILIIAADGAGSALHSDKGSEWACETLRGEVTDFVSQGGSLEAIDRDIADTWYLNVHAALVDRATELEVSPRDLACTLMCAVVSDRDAVFFQIGDGAIVVGRNGVYSPVFWPQSGEYANTTFFISESEALTHLQFVNLAETIDEVAAFSDGIQLLALNYATREAHNPFFSSMFGRLRLESPGRSEELNRQLATYLNSAIINERTDDDKTLAMATRVKPQGE